MSRYKELLKDDPQAAAIALILQRQPKLKRLMREIVAMDPQEQAAAIRIAKDTINPQHRVS